VRGRVLRSCRPQPLDGGRRVGLGLAAGVELYEAEVDLPDTGKVNFGTATTSAPRPIGPEGHRDL